MILTGMRVTMRVLTRRNNHRKPMMDQLRMWRTECILLENGKIAQHISDI